MGTVSLLRYATVRIYLAMAAANVNDQSFVSISDLDDNVLACEICKERFKTPKMLLCGHTFCLKCLETWAQENEGKELTCPTCRQPWQIPANGIGSLPSNYQVNNVVDFVLSGQTAVVGSHMKACEFCESKEAVSACLECRQLACKNCVRGHKRTKAMANHRFVSLDEYESLPAELRPSDCDKHPGIQLEYYCQTCSIPICMKCIVIDHCVPEHKHIDLGKVAIDARELMHKTLGKIEDKLNYYKEKGMNIRQLKDVLNVSKDQKITEIKTKAEDLMKEIEENEKESVKNLNTKYEAKVEILDSQLNTVDLAIDQMERSFKVSIGLLKHGTDAAVMLVCRKIQEILEGLLNEETEENNFNQEDLLSDLAVEFSQQNDKKPVASNSVVKLVQPYKKTVCRLITYNMHGFEVKQGGAEVTAQVRTEEGEIVPCNVTDNNNGTYDMTFTPGGPGGSQLHFLTVSLFGKPVKECPITVNSLVLPLPADVVRVIGGKGDGPGKFNQPLGVAVSRVGEIYVADSGNCRIQVFGMRMQYIREFNIECSGERVKPCGFAFTKDNQLVVTDFNSKQVCVCDTDGKLVRQFGKGEFQNNPLGVAVSSDGHVHVVDYSGHCVKTFTPEGGLAGIIGCNGDRRGEFNYPRSVAVNSRDQIIVTDSDNHRVQVFDSSGAFLFMYTHVSRVYWYPWEVAVDQYDNMIVSDWNNSSIRIFSPDGGDLLCSVDCVKHSKAVASLPGHPLKLIVTESDNDNHFKLLIIQIN